MKRVLILLTALLFTAACTDTPQRGEAGSAPPAEAEMTEGVQVVEIEVGTSGYAPDRFALTPGVPARLVFTRTAEASCIEHVSIPDFGVDKTELPLGERKVIEILPEEEGEYTFVCGMDMLEGALVVSA